MTARSLRAGSGGVQAGATPACTRVHGAPPHLDGCRLACQGPPRVIRGPSRGQRRGVTEGGEDDPLQALPQQRRHP